jgi:Domain of unknown function (DUF4105)
VIRFLRRLAIFVATLVAALAALWAAGALYFDLPVPSVIRAVAAALWLLGVTIAWFFVRPRGRARVVAVFVFLGIVGWWLTIQPQSERDWKPEVAVLADADIDGYHATIHNVRNFEYRSETDFTPHYDTRTYDLGQLRGLDLFVTYWGSPLIAHPILSFDFGDQGRICFSIETRSERGEAYSAIRGFYRQFELIYIAADERDVIRLRTNFRKGEDVYLYRLNLPLEEARVRFSEYAHRIHELHARPEWYNAITTNCTTSIRSQHAAKDRMLWDWRILANGKADELLYERGSLDQSAPFAEVKRNAHINARAQAANDASDFSERIRTRAGVAANY